MARVLPVETGMKRTAPLFLVLALLPNLACAPEPPEEPTETEPAETEPTLEPVFEPASAESLERSVVAVLDDVAAAREALPDDPEGAATALEKARSELLRLTDYDLPLLRAQERTYDATRHLRAGDTRACLTELEAIQEILQDLTGADVVPPEVMQRTLRLWTDARLAVETESSEAAKRLIELGQRLHNMRIKGDLALPREVPADGDGEEASGTQG